MKYFVILIAFSITSCNQASREASKTKPVILRFELDSTGQITDPQVRAQILAMGKELHKSGNKIMMTVYTEQQGSKEKNDETGWMLARTVKVLMKTQGERAAYNMGIEVKGFENPIDPINPESLINRRIEIRPLE